MTDASVSVAPITIAIVEDVESVAKTLATEIEDAFGSSARVVVEADFEHALSSLVPHLPDILVLDWYDEAVPHPESQGGLAIWEEIWKERLIPIVIWSAHEVHPEPELPRGNPLLQYIAKGPGSEERVVAFINDSLPFVLAMRQVVDDINAVSRTVLLDSAALIWALTTTDLEQRANVLLRTTRRRLAAVLDMAPENQRLAAWEQYVVPPFGASLLTGDILRDTAADEADANAFRLVLTPSCDLELRGGKCKVDSVLTARCAPIKDYLSAVRGTSDNDEDSDDQAPLKNKTFKKRLQVRLSEPHYAGLIPLPPFLDLIPSMAADLRSLDLIPVGDISTGEKNAQRFIRVVSTDSPFREHISWAYLQITGRPGLPDRDIKTWANALVSAD